MLQGRHTWATIRMDWISYCILTRRGRYPQYPRYPVHTKSCQCVSSLQSHSEQEELDVHNIHDIPSIPMSPMYAFLAISCLLSNKGKFSMLFRISRPSHCTSLGYPSHPLANFKAKWEPIVHSVQYIPAIDGFRSRIFPCSNKEQFRDSITD